MPTTPRISGSTTVRVRQDQGRVALDALVSGDAASSLELRPDGLWSRRRVGDVCALRTTGRVVQAVGAIGADLSALTFDDVAYATDGMFDPSKPTRVKIVNSGWYAVSAGAIALTDTGNPQLVSGITLTRVNVIRYREGRPPQFLGDKGAGLVGDTPGNSTGTLLVELRAGDEIEASAGGFLAGVTLAHLTVAQIADNQPVGPRQNTGRGGVDLRVSGGDVAADTRLSSAADNGLSVGVGGLYAEPAPVPTWMIVTANTMALSSNQGVLLPWGTTGGGVGQWARGVGVNAASNIFEVQEDGAYLLGVRLSVDLTTYADTEGGLVGLYFSTYDQSGSGGVTSGTTGPYNFAHQTFIHPQASGSPAYPSNAWIVGFDALVWLTRGQRLQYGMNAAHTLSPPSWTVQAGTLLWGSRIGP